MHRLVPPFLGCCEIHISWINLCFIKRKKLTSQRELKILSCFNSYFLQKVSEKNFESYLSYINFKFIDENHWKIQISPEILSFISRVYARIKWWNSTKKFENRFLLYTHTDPSPAKNMYFPRVAIKFFQTHPNVLKIDPGQ